MGYKSNNPIKCLDHGFVYLVDSMGDDAAIEQAARVSYLKAEVRKQSTRRGLIRYLMRHRHTTPFEMVQLKFHAKMPIFVARQWVRHRTASINEISGRYSKLDEEFYMPDQFNLQSQANKQGRDEDEIAPFQKEQIRFGLLESRDQSYARYEHMLDVGVSKEIARMDLPVSIYTQWYWSINLHNLFHFLSLRLDSHAQYEIRVYAEAIAGILKKMVPLAWEAFEDYRLNGADFSAFDIDFIKTMMTELMGREFDFNDCKEMYGGSDREWNELVAKLG